MNRPSDSARHTLGEKPGAEPAQASRLRDGQVLEETPAVATEVPVALIYNSVSHVVMMTTPRDLADFGLGFSLSDQVIASPEELQSLEVVDNHQGLQIFMRIPAERYFSLRGRRRNQAGLTGCGLCGVESLDQVHGTLSRLAAGPAVATPAIHKALAALPALQPLSRQTGAVHAAAWCDTSGEIALVREDVGRHNALDKLIGAMARAKIDPAGGFAVITSRCSFEMAQKAVAAGMRILVAISAPTSLALAVAARTGLTLIALARADSIMVYAGAERITGAAR